MTDQAQAVGTPVRRHDGPAKVLGTAPYAFDQPVRQPAYVHPLQASIARGRITELRTRAVEEIDGVRAVLTPENAPELASTEDGELAILQSNEVSFRGQFIGAVIADTPEIAREAASQVHVTVDAWPHDVRLDADRADLYTPGKVNSSFPTDTGQGALDFAHDAVYKVDKTYTTAWYHNNPMEPHSTVALWQEGVLTLYDSTQGTHTMRDAIAPVLGLPTEQIRVIAPHVGGGFGSKGTAHAHLILASLAAQAVPGRPVKFALTRQQMFCLAGYRTPTIQRVRLAADSAGRLSAIGMDVVEQTARIKEFAEQSAVPTRSMYAAPHRHTAHRLAALDVPVPSWMRAPGECPGMFGPEVAMDELAYACGLDPIELRIRNEPEVDPNSGKPFSSRNLVDCLRKGARRFGWSARDPRPRSHRQGRWLIGMGVAASTYPAHLIPGSSATIRFTDGRYRVWIGAADIGTGARTVLAQIAADALGVTVDRIDLELGDTALPTASVAGGSSGTASWGSTIADAAAAFREKFGDDPTDGDEAEGRTPDNPHADRYAMRAFGAQFAEVRVNEDTGEVRVPRLSGMFAAGRIVNPRTARSQFIGGMTMGLSMALHEQSVLDERFGQIVNHDFAEYHIAANADVESVQADWIDEYDPYVNPLGAKGIGEIGIVGTAAAVANGAYHATGVRVRDLPLSLDKFIG